MTKYSIFAFVIAFVVCAVMTHFMIPVLHRFKFGQNVRDDGPESHLAKQGTPTMGGIAIIAAYEIACLPFAIFYHEIVPIMIFSFAFGCIGFLDDYLKIKRKQSEGLSARAKFALQIVVTATLAIYIMRFTNIGSSIYIPFTKLSMFNLGALYLPFIFIVVLGTDNGVNFTDGLDGLNSCVTMIVALFFGIIALVLQSNTAVVAWAVMGSLIGFLIYNRYPAKIFMGDTGSLALGGFVSSFALLNRIPLYIPIIGFIYMLEVISVIIQVGYFKSSHGKRFFKMAPIHHHFEKCGYNEVRVVILFSMITLMFGTLAVIFLL